MSIFSKIITREIPAVFLYEDELCVSILDKFPGVEGQSLVIPKKEVDYVFDLEPELYTHIFAVAQKIARASDKALLAERTCLVIEGFEIPHVHIKLYPMKKENQNLSRTLRETKEADDDELKRIATKITAAL